MIRIRTQDHQTTTPSVDVAETTDDIRLTFDIPGVDEKSVEIGLEKDILTVEANATANDPTDVPLVFSEFSTGKFKRQFRVYETVNVEKAEAQVKDGVLYLRLPKVTPEVKKIQVKAG